LGTDDIASRLLGLAGLAVEDVGVSPSGVRLVSVVTASGVVPTCPSCGRPSRRHKGQVATAPWDERGSGARVRLLWRKRRWRCDNPDCPRGSFTERVPGIPARSRLTTRLRRSAGAAVADGERTVAQSGRDHDLSWPVVHRAYTAYAGEVLPAEPGPVEVLGIDEVRRGKARCAPDPATGELAQLADRWHVGFTDLSGGQGLLGQVEGRRASTARAWLEQQPKAWREAVRYVAIDMCDVFAAAVRTHLPQARIVVDCFHLVQLANNKLAEARRRLTWKMRGRRGRKSDPEWAARGLLRRNKEDLTPDQLDTLRTTLEGIGTYGKQIYQVWQAKELLRDLLRLGFKHTHVTPGRPAIAQARHKFQSFCADHAYLPELVSLAETVDKWWDGIEAYILTGITNAGSEGTNRLIKLDGRAAAGYRNPANQRMRARTATTRKNRRPARTTRRNRRNRRAAGTPAPRPG
jgi:transposase